MATGNYEQFLTALGGNESGNNYSFVSSLGFLGRFQFSEEGLQRVGFYNGDGTPWAHDFIGSWGPKAAEYGVYDKQGFLNSPAAQDAALHLAYAKVMEDVAALGLRQYEGQWIGGAPITTSGLIAGAHLVGVWNLKSYLESGGAINTRDPYGTPVSEYVSRFGGYETPFGSNPTAPAPTPAPPTGGGGSSGAGQVLTSTRPGDVLVGGNGGDTLSAGQGPDQLAGGGGADHFVFQQLPWSAGSVSDFQDGVDKLDLSALLKAHGYWGSDPVGDRYVSFENDWNGGTKVMFDTDGAGANQSWSYHLTTLKNVTPSSMNAADLVGGSAGQPSQPAPPPASGGGAGGDQVLTSSRYGDVLRGAGGSDTLRAGRGPDQLTGGGGADRFVFGETPWNAGVVTDFTPGADKLDISAIFDAAGYWGSQPVADGVMRLEDVGGSTKVHVDIDGPGGGQWPFLVTTLQGVNPWSLSANDFII